MGIIQSRQIKSAISEDGLQNVKKAAFIQSTMQQLQNQKQLMRRQWETLLQERTHQKLQFVDSQKEEVGRIFNMKVNQLQDRDPEFIDRLESKMKKGFKDITGYKKAIEKLQILRQKVNKSWSKEIQKVLEDINTQIDRIKQKLSQETPQTKALNKLDQKTKAKALSRYIEDDSYEIERDEYYKRAFDEVQKALVFEQFYQERFEKTHPNQEAFKIVKDFQQNLQGTPTYVTGCGFGW